MEVYSSVYVFDMATGLVITWFHSVQNPVKSETQIPFSHTGVWSCPIAKGINLADHTATLIGDLIYVIVSGE